MRTASKYRITLLLCSLLIASPMARADLPDLATPAAVEKLVNEGDFKTALLDISRILAMQGPAAAAYDHFQMQMLKAECQLQLHNLPVALVALAAARKEAFAKDTPTRAAEPAAMTRLLQQSKDYQYQPKAAGHPPAIPLIDRSQRKAAYKALLADDFPETLQRLKQLPTLKTLPALIELAKVAGTTRAIELIATDESSLTAPLTRNVADQAEQFVDAEIDQLADHVNTINTNANQLEIEPYIQPGDYGNSTTRRPVLTRTRRRGPNPTETQYLQSVQKTCDKISASVVELAMALIFETDTMKAMVAKADALKLQAKNILNDNYLNIPNPQ